MWTLATMACAALLWLLQITLGDDPGVDWPRHQWLSHAALGLSVLAAVLMLQRLLGHLLRGRGRTANSATSDLLRAVMTILLYLLAGMLYLSVGLGLDITSVLTTSAVLTVIIGLALQPTLGHLFAGVSIEIERPLRVGDYVRRDDIEGQVISLSWRSVYLRTERGSTVVMPNSEFNSRLLEVIAADQPFRHQFTFNIASELPPGRIMRVAMQVLCSGLRGISSSPAPSVVVLGCDPASGTLRYAARLYTLQFLDRGSITSDCLERLWYALSREGVPASAWRPDHEVNLKSAPGHLAADAWAPRAPTASSLATRSDSLSGDGPWPASFSDLPGALAAAFAEIEPGLPRRLADCARTVHYAQFERCDSGALALVVQGRVAEARPVEAQRLESTFRALIDDISKASGVSGVRRLGEENYQALLVEGSLALGPLAHNLCRRIAALTDDPHLAYRALAESIPDPAQRRQFLEQAPPQTNRIVHAGDWLGWPHVLGLEADVLACRAGNCCTLLVWPAATLRHALAAAAPEAVERLAAALRSQAPGCAGLDAPRLRLWLHGA